jgi:hypothetical protein
MEARGCRMNGGYDRIVVTVSWQQANKRQEQQDIVQG